MRTPLVVLLVVVAGVFASRDIRSCGSCGMECENACGTRNFKTCCFNYMRKRNDITSTGGTAIGGGNGGSIPVVLDPNDPSVRLELWLARSRSPLYQHFLQKAVYEHEALQHQQGEQFEKDANSIYETPTQQ